MPDSAKEPKQTAPLPPDRTQTIRDMLKHSLSEDDLVPAVRELMRLSLYLHEGVSALPDIRNSLANTHRLLIDFMADQLRVRREREEQELRVAEINAEKARTVLQHTDEKIAVVNGAKARAAETEMVKLTPAEQIWVWFKNNVLDKLGILLVFFILTAVWEYIKALVNAP